MSFRYAPLWLALLAPALLAQAPAAKPAACSLQGQVLQEPGSKPMRKVKVQLTPSAQEEEYVTYGATTDPEGKFTISDIKPGPYRLSAEHAGFFLVDEKHRVIRTQTLSLKSGDELKDLVLRMQPAGIITGKVLDRDGDPMPFVTVTATRYAVGPSQLQRPILGRTNDQGEYRITSLLPARYLISALSTRNDSDESQAPEPKHNTTNKRPERSYTTYYPASSDRNQAVPVEIHAGDEMPVNINMVFGPTFRVRGSVANLTDATDADNDVLLVAKDSSAWHDAYSAPEIKKDGSFEIRAVPPGVYYLALRSSAETGPKTTFVETLVIKDSDIENLRIAPVPVSSVHGRLRLEGGQKGEWSNFVVALASDETDSELWHQFTGETKSLDAPVNRDGNFEIQYVPAGSYRISAWSGTGPGHDSFVQSILLGGKDVMNSGLSVSGGNYSLDIVMGTHPGAIEGAVLDAGDQPVAGATVIAIPDAARRGRPDTYQSDSADQQGRFKLHGLAPGEYEVIAVEYLDDDYRDPEFLKKYENSSVVVKLEKGEHKAVSLKVAPAPGD
jgi:protocatechuate 3,4-dioxygenase beta subunit